MTKVAKNNLRMWIGKNLDLFPGEFKVKDFDTLTFIVQEDVRLFLVRQYNQNFIPKIQPSDGTLTLKMLRKIDTIDFKFITTLNTKFEKKVIQRLQSERSSESVTWGSIDSSTIYWFKKWLDARDDIYKPFSCLTHFDQLPSDIKTEWLFLLVSKIGAKTYKDMETMEFSYQNMNAIKKVKLTDSIKDAIDDVLVTHETLSFINRTDLDDWDAAKGVQHVQSTKQEEIDAKREQRKFNRKRAKLIAQVKSMKTFDMYNEIMTSELFDRNMMDIILNRLENKTAFGGSNNGYFNNKESKEILKLIVQHPLITTSDLQRISKVKTVYNNMPEYNSVYLDTALSARDDLEEKDLIKFIKKKQIGPKLEVSKKELTDETQQILIEYTIKHHFIMPDQVKLVFKNLGISINDYHDKITSVILDKYLNDRRDINGLHALALLDNYDIDIDDITIGKIVDYVIKMYNDKKVTPTKLRDDLTEMGVLAHRVLHLLFEHTHDPLFLSDELAGLFLI